MATMQLTTGRGPRERGVGGNAFKLRKSCVCAPRRGEAHLNRDVFTDPPKQNENIKTNSDFPDRLCLLNLY